MGWGGRGKGAATQRRLAKNERSRSPASSASRPPGDLGAVVELRHVQEVEDAARRAGLGVHGSEDDTRYPRQHDRARAHRTGLERHVHDGVEHAPGANGLTGLAQRQHLGVRGRVVAQFALVVPGADDLAVFDDHRPDRDVVVLEGTLGLAQRKAHVVLVPREEVV